MLKTIERLTLIAGLFTVGSLFLCGFAGIIGYFNGYLSVLLIIASICFFALIAYSLSVRFLVFYQHPVTSNRSNSVKTAILAIFFTSSLLVAHTYFLYAHVSPGENILGNRDEGMYLAAASHLNRKGSFSMDTSWVEQSPAESKRFFTKDIFPSLKTSSADRKTYSGIQAGFYLIDEKGGSQFIQFPVGYPALLATCLSIGDYTLVQHSNVILCMLCGLLLASISLNYLSKTGTLAVWLLFLFCPLTIWSANHLYAEPALLLMWLIALWTLFTSNKYPYLKAMLASMALGAGFLIKIDALPLIAVPFIYALLPADANNLRFRIAFPALSLVAYALASVVHLHYSKPYFEFTLAGLFNIYLPIIAGIGALLYSIMLLPKVQKQIFEQLQPHERLLRYGFSMTLSLLLLYFYFVRPETTEPHLIFSNATGDKMESLREQTFLRMGWYFTQAGMALACAGLITAFLKRIPNPLLAFVGVGTLFLVYYGYDIHCTPYQPRVMRRFFPYLVPLLCFCVPLLIHQFPQKLLPKTGKPILTCLVAGILLFHFQQISQRLVVRENYRGLYNHLLAVSEEIPINTLVLVNGKGPAFRYAAALRYIFDLDCILVYPDYRDQDYHDTMAKLITRADCVAVLSTTPNDRLSLRAEVESTRKLSETLSTTYSGMQTAYPENDVKEHKITLYLTQLAVP
jgi:hypothetical protein